MRQYRITGYLRVPFDELVDGNSPGDAVARAMAEHPDLGLLTCSPTWEEDREVIKSFGDHPDDGVEEEGKCSGCGEAWGVY